MTEGITAVWKPVGITSHDCIDILRRKTGIRTIGHAGTLDPLAEGILVVAIGRTATKTLSTEVAKEKEYVATIRLGAVSITDDREGPIIETVSAKEVGEITIRELLPNFVGEISQMPPIYSALKVSGSPAYKLARKGKKIELKARTVLIKDIELLEYEWPTLTVRVVTGPGVYIRALARDIGEKLGTGAYLSGLIRTRVGEFSREQALNLET